MDSGAELQYQDCSIDNSTQRHSNQTALLSEDQTLYSFRHTGAIRVFEKSGSLATLQRVMGHSDMKVSLTYLRGLEVKRLDVEDLPNLRDDLGLD